MFCEHVFDVLQKYDDDNPLCEQCGKDTQRQVSAPSFVLKGGGWYKDGYTKQTLKD